LIQNSKQVIEFVHKNFEGRHFDSLMSPSVINAGIIWVEILVAWNPSSKKL